MARRGVGISGTEAALLGLLRLGEFSGYDLFKMVRGSVGYFWAPAQSQIYAVLPRLVRAGYATSRTVRQESRPDKQLYRITPEGEAALDRWLRDPHTGAPVAKNPFLLKLFLGEFMDPDAVADHIAQGRERAAAELAELARISPNVDAHPYDGYLLDYGIEVNRAFVRWADDVLDDMQRAASRRKRRTARTAATRPPGASAARRRR